MASLFFLLNGEWVIGNSLQSSVHPLHPLHPDRVLVAFLPLSQPSRTIQTSIPKIVSIGGNG